MKTIVTIFPFIGLFIYFMKKAKTTLGESSRKEKIQVSFLQSRIEETTIIEIRAV